MHIHVETFAALADELGHAALSLELPDGATVADALDEIARLHPAVATWRPRLATAVNLSYVKSSHVLREGDTLALIPPVSGG